MKKLVFYTYPSCTSCRKAKGWLKQHDISYEERHLFRDRPNVSELMELLKLSKSGVEDILATRSTLYKQLNVDLDTMPLSQALQLLSSEPRLLRRPILTDGEKLVVGYHSDDLMRITADNNESQVKQAN
ncbi:Spx/MgsR family RNA polymerase-binding regulatory protein [Sporolactobacillus shoreae]|uniref:Spx/MgsR family RNA polymerase-binding regulatory protein n=1 Tax=Sporolactobacillus shoreae TaxID=1465501 RepID=A0A4Z0GKT2_9BACL|nr:Spx/MgsR family RNA polymerase-binding regulatory protein [Sporolactobacillus shoreae]TGA96721.1 Spx/MgsR family RNA polymerase-binding regulatory protein [Sporolactobacillus shoreae]